MDGDWERLGNAVRDARNSKGLSQKGLATLAGKKRTVIQTIERGHRFRSVTKTLRNVERALGWGQGSVSIILAGGEPLGPDRADELVVGGQLRPGFGEGLPIRVVRALAQGATLDTTIVPLSPTADMVIVVKVRTDATPDEVQDALLAWEQGEGYLTRLSEHPDEPPRSPEE